MQVSDLLQVLFRWAHIVAGILWIGLLFFFNWINGAFAKTLDAETKKKVIPELMPRALFWFRWGAAWTWITGIALLALVYYHGQLMGFDEGWGFFSIGMVILTFGSVFIYDILFKSVEDQKKAISIGFGIIAAEIFLMKYLGGFGYRAYNIHIGVMFGTIMAFNVWFRIWPAQQKIITAIKNGEAPEGDLVALAGERSRHNTYLSVPLVYTMINQHTVLVGSYSFLILLGAIALGWVAVKHLYSLSAKVEGF